MLLATSIFSVSHNVFKSFLHKLGILCWKRWIVVKKYDMCNLIHRCKINCLAKVGVTSHLQLVPDVPHNCPASYEWAIHNKVGPVVNTSYDLLPDLLSANLTETGTKVCMMFNPFPHNDTI